MCAVRLSDCPVRHGWAWLRSEWHSFLQTPISTEASEAIEQWRRQGRPFVVASAAIPSDVRQIRLGLATTDKQRIGFQLDSHACLATAAPPALCKAATVAPASWKTSLERLSVLARVFGFHASVYGSLAWTYRTGVKFVREDSDLDLLLTAHTATLHQTYAFLELLHADRAPPRLDGELLLEVGAVAWREFVQRPAELLVKHNARPRLHSRAQIETASFGDPS